MIQGKDAGSLRYNSGFDQTLPFDMFIAVCVSAIVLDLVAHLKYFLSLTCF